MARRREERERRRREREEAERTAQRQSARARRLQAIGGVVLGVAVIAVVIILVVAGGMDHRRGATASAATLDQAAQAAGCTLKSPPIEGRDHTSGTVTYKSNPPTSGAHNPQPAPDGVYDPGTTPAPENYVHSLEHGRIELQYAPGSSQKTIDALVALFNEPVNGSPGYHALLFQNNTGMPAAVAATAWGHMITCPRLDAATIDALRTFRERYTDKGPEFIP
ncbi:MAG: DUF3105 domain-containing protein [Solirubrobacteraceae bacterium]